MSTGSAGIASVRAVEAETVLLLTAGGVVHRGTSTGEGAG